MNYLVRNLDSEIQEKSLLKHTFYTMWTEGKLTREHLAGYSQEYFQLVKAVPTLVGTIGGFVDEGRTRTRIAGIKDEESEHVELWAKFAESMGVSRANLMAYSGTLKTRNALFRLSRQTEASFTQGAGAMYAIESEQPKISRTKLEGLKSFYGMTGEEDGTEYFREHQVADVRHAAFWRGQLQKQGTKDGKAVVEAASVSMGVQNSILDSVMETFVTPTI